LIANRIAWLNPEVNMNITTYIQKLAELSVRPLTGNDVPVQSKAPQPSE
jgi:hypothetical protein